MTAWPSERRLAVHVSCIAWARARERAGARMAIRSAMMPMTTRSSTRVNARSGVRLSLRSAFILPPSSFCLHSSGEDAVGVDDKFLGGAFVEVLVALGGLVEGDGGDVYGFCNFNLVV